MARVGPTHRRGGAQTRFRMPFLRLSVGPGQRECSGFARLVRLIHQRYTSIVSLTFAWPARSLMLSRPLDEWKRARSRREARERLVAAFMKDCSQDDDDHDRPGY